jgi:hypothetical protein
MYRLEERKKSDHEIVSVQNVSAQSEQRVFTAGEGFAVFVFACFAS